MKDFMFPQPYGGVKQEEIPEEFSKDNFIDIKYREDIEGILVGLLGAQTEWTNYFVGMWWGVHDIVWSVFDTEKKEYKWVWDPDTLVKMLTWIDRYKLTTTQKDVLLKFEDLLFTAHWIQIERSENKWKVREVLNN
jgi:hypothetical protein